MISVRVKCKEKSAFGTRKSRVYCAQSIRLECAGKQTLWTWTSAQNWRFCIFVLFCIIASLTPGDAGFVAVCSVWFQG